MRVQVSAVWKVLDVVAVVAVASWVRGRRQIDGFWGSDEADSGPVSYTHLTLPTTCGV